MIKLVIMTMILKTKMNDSENENGKPENIDIASRGKIAHKPDVDEYIKGPDKYPLEENRFGYLPFIVQKFINTDNKKCQVSNINKNLKKTYNRAI